MFCLLLSYNSYLLWLVLQIGASFTRDSQGFSLVEITRREPPITDGFTVNSNVRELIYRRFSTLPQTVYYWSLPQRFLGDKVRDKCKEPDSVSVTWFKTFNSQFRNIMKKKCQNKWRPFHCYSVPALDICMESFHGYECPWHNSSKFSNFVRSVWSLF